MPTSTLLSVGSDKYLMHSRTMLLRHAGFIVDEAFNVNAALAQVKADSIDAVLICHTIPSTEQLWLISAVHDVKPLLPIICINDRDFYAPQKSCAGTTNDPSHLLEAVRKVLHICLCL